MNIAYSVYCWLGKGMDIPSVLGVPAAKVYRRNV